MKTNTNIIILGAGFAGMMAALRLANRTRHQSVAITLVNASATFVERTRLHQNASGQTVPAKSLRTMLQGTKVNFVQGKAMALDPVRRTVTVNASEGVQTLSYDKLIYALGSHTDLSRIPGATEHAYAVEQHAVLFEHLHKIAPSHGRVLVIGGGLTGIEIATEMAETHPALRVAMATSGTLGEDLSKMGARYLAQTFQRLGITVHEHVKVLRLEAERALTAANEQLSFDVCIDASGFGVSPLAQQAGLAVNPRGQILVNAFLHSITHPDIYAIGDAAIFEQSAELSVRMGCVTAIPLAIHAAENLACALAGKAEQPFQFGYVIRCISLGRHNGLVQFVDGVDHPRESVLTGRVGAAVKELILHYVMWSLQIERRFAFYRWPHTQQAHPQTPTPTTGLGTAPLLSEVTNH
ncbi:MAG: FAD-dependent oxidoreductase [Chloroflexi bacterium]|nr:FAD-dependent oxidoreductase [Chloroflexota bacterium]